MFQDLDSTLFNLLKQQLPAALVGQFSISFMTPDNQFPPSSVVLPAVDFFLYDIRQNFELRNMEPTFEPQLDGRVLRVPPPARVDCSYLITAWPQTSAPNPDQDEHKLLGEVLKVLLVHREIPAAVLQGSMKSLRMPIRTVVSPSSSLQNLGEFWQALGGKARAAVSYTVTLAVDIGASTDVGVPAVDLNIPSGAI